ncbi:MAG TPA: 1-acyl-sn-glycerol-3-phosphate acyltransferase [Chitinophagaceae bacterium]|nr:1-acyl-sn-glycerol-3-phosphate acyltransferase [Chitinophagaceae bacterium]
MTVGLRFFYRHLYVTGFENIPASGPVIIIANHNSSLMDAALLGILLKRKAWFFTRGDVFANGFVAGLLKRFHMIPVHSHAGGRNTLDDNKDGFLAGRDILVAGGIIVFFPESSSHTEHHLLPFRKGVFRIAFEAAAATGYKVAIPVIPVGINYDHPTAGRTAVNIHAGAALQVLAYQEEYLANPAAALLHLCKDAHEATSRLVLHIADRRRMFAAATCLTIGRNDRLRAHTTWIITSREKLALEREICAAVNSAAQERFAAHDLLAQQYQQALANVQLTDTAVCPQFFVAPWKSWLLPLAYPLYLLGLVLNGAPVWLARQIANKKVYREDFYSWIFVACYCFAYLGWLLLLTITTGLLLGFLPAILLLGITMGSGWFAYHYHGNKALLRMQATLKSLPPARLDQLRRMRSQLQAGNL